MGWLKNWWWTVTHNPVLDYSRDHNGRAIVVMKDGAILDQEGQNGGSLSNARDIESGTKSFNGVILKQMVADGLVPSYDAPVSGKITEWATASTQKQTCTLRRLLCMTSGLNPGATGSNPTYPQSIGALMPAGEVGTFKYGPNPFGVFGEYVKRAAPGFADAVDYLRRRVLNAAGVTVASWDYLAPGQPHMAGGAHMTAGEWAKFGEFIRLGDFSDLTGPGPDYWAYGLNWWRTFDSFANAASGNADPNMATPGFSAAGANNQRLLIVPASGVVVARLGAADTTWSDETFLDLVMQRYG